MVVTPVRESGPQNTRKIQVYELHPLKFNMEPKNRSPLEKEIPNLETIIFRFQPFNFREGIRIFAPEIYCG